MATIEFDHTQPLYDDFAQAIKDVISHLEKYFKALSNADPIFKCNIQMTFDKTEPLIEIDILMQDFANTTRYHKILSESGKNFDWAMYFLERKLQKEFTLP